MEQETDKMEDGKECEVPYAVGDLLWAKIGHFPYWPCMVSYDPFSGSYHKKKKTRSGDAIVYHVQYFGEKTQHGWTTPGLVMPYEGEKAFYDKKEQLIATKSSHFGYNIPSKVHKAWTLAVKEAEEAREYDIDERYESYVFKYEYNSKKSTPPKKSTKKRKRNWGSSKKSKKTKELNGTGSRVCSICDKGNVDLLCSGRCSLYFHKACLGLLVAPNNFRCIHCEKGLATCFVCKKSVDCTFDCNKCEHKYHYECVKVFPCIQFSKDLCPYHACLTCEKRKFKGKASGTLVNCIRCPTSFHANVDCLPAGSVKHSTTTMVCPDHFWGKNRVSRQVTSNVSYCFSCSEGGQLICCESCPNSFHAACIDKEVPKEDFFCEDCEKRCFLYVGMVVWAKTGNFRWWPAQILDVEELPLNVKNMEHFDGEFPVQYFGTEEYFWTHRGRVIPYSINHKGFYVKGPKTCQLDKHFHKSLTEASKAFDQYRNEQRVLSADKGNPYKPIKVNRLVPPAQIDASVSKSCIPCKCTGDKPFACVIGSSCLNISTHTECDLRICNAGENCGNRKFQRRQYAKVKVFKTENRGWGLLSDQLITKGMFVIEYVGEIITHAEYRKRLVDMQERNEQNYYFLYLDSRRIIDAGPAGNLARFINHACTANCVMTKWSVNGDARIGIFALQNILPGTELTFNYQYDDISFQHECVCGTANCQGFFGKKPEKEKGECSKEGPKKKSKEKVKK